MCWRSWNSFWCQNDVIHGETWYLDDIGNSVKLHKLLVMMEILKFIPSKTNLVNCQAKITSSRIWYISIFFMGQKVRYTFCSKYFPPLYNCAHSSNLLKLPYSIHILYIAEAKINMVGVHVVMSPLGHIPIISHHCFHRRRATKQFCPDH